MNQCRLKILGVVCIMLFVLPHMIIAEQDNVGSGFSIKDYYFIEPGPTVQSTLYADGSVIELQTESVTWPMIGSDMTNISPKEFKEMVRAGLEAYENDKDKIIIDNGGTRSGIDIIFSVSSPPPGATAAFAAVESYLEGLFTEDPVTVYISVSFSHMGGGVLGWTQSYYASGVSWSTTRNGLQNGRDWNDTIQVWLPSTSYIPVRYNGGSSTVTNEYYCYFTKANYRATIGSVSGTAASMGFNLDFTWDYDPSNGVSGHCFQSVVAHEVGHALGFTSAADFRPGDIEALDIYRFPRLDGSQDYNPDTYAEFQVRPRYVDDYNDDNHNSDIIIAEYRMEDGNPYQCSHFRTSVYALMDPNLATGETFWPNFYKTPDLNMFDAIGWDYPATPNNPPYAPSNPSPSDDATGVDIDADLSWTGGDPDAGDTVVYDVYFEANDATPDVLVSDDQSGTTYDPGTMNYNTHYYWKIVAKDNHDATTTGPIWDFWTEPPPEYTLTIIIDGSGSVDAVPPGPTYPPDTPVELTANPDAGWSFDHWEGGLTGSQNPDTIIMDSDKTVTAYFTQNEYTLTIYIEGAGSVVADPVGPTYPSGTEVQLLAVPAPEDTADPDPEWIFDHWSGDLEGSQNPDTITMDDDKTVTATFTYTLNLADFPMYDADSPFNEMCGPAVGQMALNYMWWNSITDPDSAPMTFDNQTTLYDTGIVHNSNPGLDYFDMQGMWFIVQNYKPGPYSQYGYNFTREQNVDSTVMLKRICQWIDYRMGEVSGGHEDGHPMHVPAIIPAYGGYTNWMAIRGIHTDTIAYPMPDTLEIYGFWMNDPLPGGIGENSFKTVTEFLSGYYYPLATGDEWDGKYVGIFEPPEAVEGCRLIIAQPMPNFTDEQINQLELIEDLNNISLEMKIWIIQAAIDGVNEELIPYDENFKAVFETTVPGEPFFVKSLNDNNNVQSLNNNDYFAVPFVFGRYFGEVSPKKEVNNELPVLDNKAMVVILIDASDGSFKEASWTDNPDKYLPILREEAQQIAFDVTQTLGLEVDINSLQPELVHRQSTPYYPEWRVIIEKYAIYISQDGTVSIEEFVEGGTGSGGVMSEEGSFVYSLNTAAPTPFVNSTMISYSIAQSGHVSLDIYDVTGRLVKTLVHANKDAGVYSLRWNGCDNNNRKLATGVYFTKLTSRDFTSVKKIILAR